MATLRRQPLPPSDINAAKAKTLPRASIIVPTLNESRHIGALLQQLIDFAPPEVTEIFVSDGGSTDGTQEIVRAFEARDRRILLISNHGRIQAIGVNIAAKASSPQSEVLIRMDSHAAYGNDFVKTLLTEMGRPELHSVVVRMVTVGEGCFQRAVAMVSNTAAGTGGSAHRIGAESKVVDHGHHAAFRRRTFLDLGGYDETFATNEDAEFDHRLMLKGGRIWLSVEADVRYFPRSSPFALARQYFKYGAGRFRTMWKHRVRPKLRQLIPVLLTLYLLASFPVALLVSPIMLLPLGAYGALLAGATVSALSRNPTLCTLWVPVALVVMHVSWGLGFLSAIARWHLTRPSTPVQEAFVEPVEPSAQKERGSSVKAVSAPKPVSLPERAH
ncbi:glycosyltransferase family 2 protein [Bosea sp. NBC_00550]|uniref:glycosyltransferase family 2 protein n=1 Tax=Bosea sp. NBC_00550 TaxID=2969621 RepID=UPI00223095E3|nr:glycosyltransferase family 2 protein [Bosea sp. NBC_00550]UZF94387.1 glycosyltransferase family 2 protein [Bosea sp. NBC_00550]